MKILFASPALVLITIMSATAVAADPPASPTRTQVKESLRDAKAAGQTRVGEDGTYPAAQPTTTGKPIKRKAKRVAPAVEPATVK